MKEQKLAHFSISEEDPAGMKSSHVSACDGMRNGLFLYVGHGIDVHILGDGVNDARMHVALIA
jgi:hypothetical protein